MYNRYIPEDMSYSPVEKGPPSDRPQNPGFRLPDFRMGKEGLSGLLKGLHLDGLDSGDILLILIALLLWKEGDDPDLLIALGLVFILGLGEE